jgi:predicted Zn-dependent protease with MMP-like domain
VDTGLSTQEFEALVERAIASVPEPLARVMENVGVILVEQASPWQSVLGL